MTCVIAAWEEFEGRISFGIASDSQVTTKNGTANYVGAKFTRIGDYLIGFGGNHKACSIAEEVIMEDDEDPATFLKRVSDTVDEFFKKEKENDKPFLAGLLVCRDGLWFLTDRAVDIVAARREGLHRIAYDSGGSGHTFALGAYCAQKHIALLDRLVRAVDAAITHNSTCGGLIHVHVCIEEGGQSKWMIEHLPNGDSVLSSSSRML